MKLKYQFCYLFVAKLKRFFISKRMLRIALVTLEHVVPSHSFIFPVTFTE